MVFVYKFTVFHVMLQYAILYLTFVNTNDGLTMETSLGFKIFGRLSDAVFQKKQYLCSTKS